MINPFVFAITTFCFVNIAVAGAFPFAMESYFNLAVAEAALLIDNRDASDADRALADATTERSFSLEPASGAPFGFRTAIDAVSASATLMTSAVGSGRGSSVESNRVVARGPLGGVFLHAGQEAASASFSVTGMATPTPAVVAPVWPMALIAVAGLGLGAYARRVRHRRAASI